MTDLERIQRTVAIWTERKLKKSAERNMSAKEASLTVMDSFERWFHLLSDKDLWVSCDYKEWCIYLRLLNGRTFFVNELTLSYLNRR